MAAKKSTPATAANPQDKTLANICERALFLSANMIQLANERPDKQKGDPKVGGHQAACASSLHILGALHLLVKTGYDHLAVKPHAAPQDHAYNYLLDLFLKKDGSRFSADEAVAVMHKLRAYPQENEAVFQSYHSHHDPDHHNFLPSGTVGIPPVNAGYLALAYRFAKEHGYAVPDAHFWALIGDAEFREGSLYEAMPDFAERQLGNLTWIVDYNRQSLDGHRISNKRIMGGTDDVRLENTAKANGWHTIQLRHGLFRKSLFARKGGDVLQNFLETQLEDYELQALLLVHDAAQLRPWLLKVHPQLKSFLSQVSDEELYRGLHDMGGHDIWALAEAMEESKRQTDRPTLIIAHTIKGWGLPLAGQQGNHSALLADSEMLDLRKRMGLDKTEEAFPRFANKSNEADFLRTRGEQLYTEMQAQYNLKTQNQEFFAKGFAEMGQLPPQIDINLRMASYPHTQWMLGQITAKLSRIANTPLTTDQLPNDKKSLSAAERPWKIPSELLVTMAPDVGTSTNLNPAMDGKIFGVAVTPDYESQLGVKESKVPDLVPGEENSDRFLRFDISEANVMSCLGSFGQMRDTLGIPLLPLMTVYDFFIKRALDQYFYNLYWGSSFILVGTPSGVTLSPEGAQHGWKSDIQIPNQVTWEPYFCQELDWILTESIRRHIENDTKGRNGVLIRAVTRGAEQKDMLKYLRRQLRFKIDQAHGHKICVEGFAATGTTDEKDIPAIGDEQIMESVRQDVLAGAYYLIDYRGYYGYEPGDNVVHIFAMGALTTEAIEASNELLTRGIYANVIVVTSPDLLLGNLAHENHYQHLRHGLGINGDLYFQPGPLRQDQLADLVTVAGRRVPIVSVHDGEPGLLDNIGSVIGTRQEALAVRRHSRCGRPMDVFKHHHIDPASIVETVGQVLAETALESVQVSPRLLGEVAEHNSQKPHWRELWPQVVRS